MSTFVELVALYAPWIYGVCGLASLYHVYKVWQVRTERRQAVFSLERDKAKRDLYNVFFVVFLLVMAMSGTYFVSDVLAQAVALPESVSAQRNAAPVVEPEQESAQTVLSTPTNTPLPATNTPPPTDVVPPTVEPVEIATEPPVEVPPTAAPAPVVQAPSCPDERARITQPGNGQTVSGSFNIVGIAAHENFDYYKIEYAAGANVEGGYVFLYSATNQVTGGLLATVNAASFGSGAWTFRLVVVDKTGNFVDPPCRVTVNIQN